MALSLTCACGALLEVDDKFAGQTIHCPDCNRPINTAAPELNPPFTSGFALASLLLALVGAFTLFGTALAIACGLVGLRQIRRHPEQWGGKRLAQAGIYLGAVFTILTILLLANTELVRLDGLLRVIESAGAVEYAPTGEIDVKLSGAFNEPRYGTIQRPGPAWGRLTNRSGDREKTDDLILVNLWEDAYIVCLTEWLDQQTDLTPESYRQKGLKRLLQSELVTKILQGAPTFNSSVQERDSKKLPGTDAQEFLIDLRLRNRDWTFLIRVARDGPKLNIVVGGTRQHRFGRLQPDIAKALASYKMDKE